MLSIKVYLTLPTVAVAVVVVVVIVLAIFVPATFVLMTKAVSHSSLFCPDIVISGRIFITVLHCYLVPCIPLLTIISDMGNSRQSFEQRLVS